MRRKGVTLLEMLVAMVIVAILASLAIRVTTSKSAAALALMRSDLRNLALAQEAYYSTSGTYANNIADLGFETSENVTIRLRGNSGGWSGRTESQLHEDVHCALFVGRVVPFLPATEEGIMACEPRGGGGCSGA